MQILEIKKVGVKMNSELLCVIGFMALVLSVPFVLSLVKKKEGFTYGFGFSALLLDSVLVLLVLDSTVVSFAVLVCSALCGLYFHIRKVKQEFLAFGVLCGCILYFALKDFISWTGRMGDAYIAYSTVGATLVCIIVCIVSFFKRKESRDFYAFFGIVLASCVNMLLFKSYAVFFVIAGCIALYTIQAFNDREAAKLGIAFVLFMVGVGHFVSSYLYSALEWIGIPALADSQTLMAMGALIAGWSVLLAGFCFALYCMKKTFCMIREILQ